jgi:hypothetical protein
MTIPSDDATICPHCQHANPAGVTRCAHCGKEFTQTVSVPDVDVTALPVPAGVPVDLAPNKLILMVAFQKTPITVERSSHIRIGRAVAGHPAPDVDLTPYNAYKLGVSRLHAVIHCEGEGCTLEDLGSANGTWLNEVRLLPGVVVPLTNGAQVRLGHLNISVYFA